MIITDYNQMSLNELQIVAGITGIEFQINDGKIVGTVEKSVD